MWRSLRKPAAARMSSEIAGVAGTANDTQTPRDRCVRVTHRTNRADAPPLRGNWRILRNENRGAGCFRARLCTEAPTAPSQGIGSMRYWKSAIGATGLACVLAAPGEAQTAGGEQQHATAQPQIETVTVTARRRPEDLEKTPVAVTVLSAEELRTDEIKSPLDLQNFAPSLSVTGNLGSRDNDVFSIRGQSQTFGGADPGVQTYFAEVPFNASGQGNDFDLDDIQVANGPQGTLFGRSTTGGAVLFEPRRPGEEFGGYLETRLGDYDLQEFDGALNVPVIDKTLLVRGAFDIENRDGFTKDTVITGAGAPYTEEQDNINTEAFRLGITARPFAHFENYLVFDYLHDRNNGTGAVLTGINTNTIAGLAVAYTGAPCTSPPTNAVCGALAAFQAEMAGALAAQQAAGPRNTTSSIPVFYRREIVERHRHRDLRCFERSAPEEHLRLSQRQAAAGVRL